MPALLITIFGGLINIFSGFASKVIHSGAATKLLFLAAFTGIVALAVTKITDYAFSYTLPVLPEMIRYLGTKAGLFVAVNIYLKIVIFGWIAKQTLAFFRTVN